MFKLQKLDLIDIERYMAIDFAMLISTSILDIRGLITLLSYCSTRTTCTFDSAHNTSIGHMYSDMLGYEFRQKIGGIDLNLRLFYTPPKLVGTFVDFIHVFEVLIEPPPVAHLVHSIWFTSLIFRHESVTTID